MKNKFMAILIGAALVSCGNTTPPSPAGTWTDTAVNLGGICSIPSGTATFIFIVNEPNSNGSITATLKIQQPPSPESVVSLSGTLTGNSVTMTGNVQTQLGANLLTINGSFNYSQKSFTGTSSGKCAPNVATIGTYNFTAIKP